MRGPARVYAAALAALLAGPAAPFASAHVLTLGQYYETTRTAWLEAKGAALVLRREAQADAAKWLPSKAYGAPDPLLDANGDGTTDEHEGAAVALACQRYLEEDCGLLLEWAGETTGPLRGEIRRFEVEDGGRRFSSETAWQLLGAGAGATSATEAMAKWRAVLLDVTWMPIVGRRDAEFQPGDPPAQVSLAPDAQPTTLPRALQIEFHP